jgi:hypothetical protein
VGKLIFGSTGERHNYYHLQKIWGEKWKVYHNIPFRNFCKTKGLIDLTSWKSEEVKLSKEEVEALNTTSVDYVICSRRDEVVIGVEFDGMGLGYSCGSIYRPQRQVSERRLRMIELKLKVAFGSNTPFVVVGPQEFVPLGQRCNLSIVDGIIGRILSSQAWMGKLSTGFIPEMVGVNGEIFNTMAHSEQAFLIDDYAMGVEVMAELANDPISRKIMELEARGDTKGWRLSYPTPPQMEASPSDPEYCECAVSVEKSDGTLVPSSTKIRSFNSPFFMMAGLLERVAKLQALLKV